MSKFKRFSCLIFIIEIALVLLCNGFYLYQNKNDNGRMYRVEAKRIAERIEEGNLSEAEVLSMDLSEYETIVAVSKFIPEEKCANDYIVTEVNDHLYRIEYRIMQEGNTPLYMNLALLCMICITGVVLFYVDKKVLQPFQSMSNLSYELAKGNLSTPVQEEKSKLFGRFLWGMDMLREKLEENKEKELEFQKDRKTLILASTTDGKIALLEVA